MVIVATLVALAALVAATLVGIFRAADGVVGQAVQDDSAQPRALQAREAFVTAVGAGDTDAFGALWCADPPPGGTAEEIAATLDAEEAAHGPVTGASVQAWEPLLPRGPSTVDIRVEHGTVERDWTAVLVEEPGRGWRVCGAGPHAP